MSYLKIEQHSTEWWQFKVGRVSGTRFGKLISGRDNGLIYEIVNELLDGHITPMTSRMKRFFSERRTSL